MTEVIYARDQVGACLARCPLAPWSLHERGRSICRALEAAFVTNSGASAALSAASRIIVELESAQREANRDARLTRAELRDAR